jgi:hypothetical protein
MLTTQARPIFCEPSRNNSGTWSIADRTDQFTTLKIDQDRSVGHQNRHAASSGRNRSLGMIEPIIESSDANTQQLGRLGLR